ncbi:hypothetical protein [Oxalicibacterium faecigallinarum]|uniref:hypothetical protein n=1 Tax=Oxalicibacterium faecigallinarum TaxID=573741 RepID=UPI001667A3F4|nr:hypothetical protein [Oxalicibacterium faecigallinarum]
MSIRSVAKAAFWSKDRTSGKISIQMSGVSQVMAIISTTSWAAMRSKPEFHYYFINQTSFFIV